MRPSSKTFSQQRLVKMRGRMIRHARCYWLLLAESHLTRRLFAAMLRRIAALPLPAGQRLVANEKNSAKEGGRDAEVRDEVHEDAAVLGLAASVAPTGRSLRRDRCHSGRESGRIRDQWVYTAGVRML
jgi:hypothetical protein